MKRALVIGGYGLIGSACMRALETAGFEVSGLGRSRTSACRSNPRADWHIHDIQTLSVEDWIHVLRNFEVVVNASGILQDGPKDDLTAIHETAISRMLAALEGQATRLIHISAAGVSQDANTEFLRSKFRGDALIRAHARNWVILRPTLVISGEAYGGTALLRAAASIPVIGTTFVPDSCVQTVSVEDVAHAVVLAALGCVPCGTCVDLTEEETRTLSQTLSMFRIWQGHDVPGIQIRISSGVLFPVSKLADALGRLGWRSPLRTSAVMTLRTGVRGDAAPWKRITGHVPASLPETLHRIPATHQERVFARAYLALPIIILTLSFFWITSGLIGLLKPEDAAAVLTSRGVSQGVSHAFVYGGSVLDLVLGLAVLNRSWVRPACLGMVMLSLSYVVGSLVLAPDLWLDPLGPMVKVLPSIVLAVSAWLLMDER